MEAASTVPFKFGKRCREAGTRLSMGSVGDRRDNAMAESFFASLESELLDRSAFQNLVEARREHTLSKPWPGIEDPGVSIPHWSAANGAPLSCGSGRPPCGSRLPPRSGKSRPLAPFSISRRGEGPAATAKHRLPLRPGSGIAVVRGPGPAACPLASPRGRFQAHTTRIRVIGRCRASQGFGHALTRTASNARRRSRPGASGSACLSVQGIEENRNVSDCVTPAPFVASSTAR